MGIKKTIEPSIIQCPNCMTLNNVVNCPNGARPLCSKCKTPLAGVRREKNAIPKKVTYALALMCFIGTTLIILLMIKAPARYYVDFSDIETLEYEKTETIKQEYNEQLKNLEQDLQAEVENISATALQDKARKHYSEILESRRTYDKKYALTLREKAQLKMAELASLPAQSYRESIASVAIEAAPAGADVNVIESLNGAELHIDFDMSSMTSGEYGTRTKHHTKESLKNEVETLISRVTTDVYVFCKDLKIQTIHVGCRHMVRTTYPNGRITDENTMLYKIQIHRNQVKSLSSNPFLHSYSTRKFWTVDKDNFDDIYISTTRL